MLKKRLVNENEGNTGMIILVIFGVCVCSIFLGISGAIAGYFMLQKKEAPFDKKLLEYRDKTGSHIIKSLPFDIKDAYYINMPVDGNKRYRFTGKSCYDGICDDVNLKNVEAINLYEDNSGLFTKPTLLSGKLEYHT